MKCFVLLAMLVFTSKNKNDPKNSVPNLGKKIMENAADYPILVKIEEDEYDKRKSKSSKYFGVHYNERTKKYIAQRWSKNEKKVFFNGYYRDEETAAHASDTLARKLMAEGEKNHKLNFPGDSTEVCPQERTTSSNYIGVHYDTKNKKWVARGWSKTEKKVVCGGTYHRDEETAAHASDNLARKLKSSGEGHKLNFPDDYIQVQEKTTSSKYFGVFYAGKLERWQAQRWSQNEKKLINNRRYKDEETAAHASDTLARKLTDKGEQKLKLNFSDDSTEVYPERTKNSKFVGVTFNGKHQKWIAQRWSKGEKKTISNGCHKDEKTAARASDSLARKLMGNSEQTFKLNFPDDSTEVYFEKKTKTSKYFGVSFNEKPKTWSAKRWSKNHNKVFYCGCYKGEITAAYASDSLARELMADGEQNHKLNFPGDKCEVRRQQFKRKRPDFEADGNGLDKLEEKEK